MKSKKFNSKFYKHQNPKSLNFSNFIFYLYLNLSFNKYIEKKLLFYKNLS